VSDGPRTNGTLGGWISAVREVMHLPRMALAVYGALVPALQKILGIPNFGIVWVGEPCSGKSMATGLGASVWGNPDPIEDGAFTLLWAEGRSALEGMVTSRNNMPYVLDDLRLEPAVPFMVDSILAGRGVCQGERCSWRTVLMTSAPSPLEEMPGGLPLVGKLVTVFGSPFGAQGPNEAILANRMRCAIGSSYGQLGPEFDARVEAHSREWDTWKNGYHAAVQIYAGTGGKRGGKGAAHGAHLAALATTGEILHSLFPEIKGSPQKLMDELWRWMLGNGKIASKSQEAWDIVRSYVAMKRKRIWNGSNPVEPPGGWIGRSVEHDGYRMYYINEEVVETLLTGAGLDPLTIYREWAMEQLVEFDKRISKQVWIHTKTVRCIGFPGLL